MQFIHKGVYIQGESSRNFVAVSKGSTGPSNSHQCSIMNSLDLVDLWRAPTEQVLSVFTLPSPEENKHYSNLTLAKQHKY